jgi:hypothetical protein
LFHPCPLENLAFTLSLNNTVGQRIMRAFIAATIGALVGFLQFLLLAFLDASRDASSMPAGDVAYSVFAATWIAEMFGLIVIAMYRVSPWIARLLRDDWEASRILRDKKSHISIAECLSSAAIVVRVVIRIVDSGHISLGSFLGVVFASLPFVLSHPERKKPNQPSQPRGGARPGGAKTSAAQKN